MYDIKYQIFTLYFLLHIVKEMDLSLHTVRGTFHQGDRRFAESMGKQCVPNSIMAIIYTNILPLNQWKTEHLDSILIAGDTLYKYIDTQHDYLLINDIPNTIEAFGKQYQIEKTMEIFGVLSNTSSESIGQTLEQAIMSMINTDKITNAVMCIGSSESVHSAGYACGLMIGATNCYIFDPHSRDMYGTPADPGTSVLIHFTSPEQCCAHLYMLGYTLYGSQFEINIINVTHLIYSKDTSTSIKGGFTKKKQLTREEYLEIRKAKNREYMRAKRQENSYKEKERFQNQESKRLSRQNIILKQKEDNARQQKRSNSEVKEKEMCAKRKQRSDPKVREREASAKRQKRMDPKVKEREASAMRQKRMDPKVKEKEVSAMRQKRMDPKMKEKEVSAMRQKRINPEVKEREVSTMRQKRSDPKVKEREANAMKQKRTDPKFKENEASTKKQRRSNRNMKDKEEEKCNQRHYGSTLTDLLQIFNESTSLGPIFVCTCCQQIWFRHSVYDIQKIHFKSSEEKQIFQKCRTHYVSVNKKEWICTTCRLAIKEIRIPKLSVFNKMGFPDIPSELEIFPMEERLIALQIAFIQLRDHPICRQTFSKGNMVNVPINIVPTINMLPRDIRDTQTIAIKFKRKKQYKCCEFYENIRPLAVWKALKYLMLHAHRDA